MRDATGSTQQADHYTIAQTWAAVRGIWVILRAWPGIFPLVFLLGALLPLAYGESDPLRALLVAGVTAAAGSVAVVSVVSRTHRVFGYKRRPRDRSIWPLLSLTGVFLFGPLSWYLPMAHAGKRHESLCSFAFHAVGV